MRDVGSGSQIDIILDVITEGIGKSRLEIFVGVPAGTTSEIQNHALRRHDAAARFENRVIELNDALSGRVFDHRVAILRTLASRVQVVGVDSAGLCRGDQPFSAANVRVVFGGARRVSITPYEKVHEMEKAEEWAEKILFSYCDARGIYTRTYVCRFDQFDDMAIGCLGREFPAS